MPPDNLKQVENDFLDVALWLQHEYRADSRPPVVVFGIGMPGTLPDLDPSTLESYGLEGAWSMLLLDAHHGLQKLGYRPDDIDVLVMRDPGAQYVDAGPLRRRRAVYRMSMMGVGDDQWTAS